MDARSKIRNNDPNGKGRAVTLTHQLKDSAQNPRIPEATASTHGLMGSWDQTEQAQNGSCLSLEWPERRVWREEGEERCPVKKP